MSDSNEHLSSLIRELSKQIHDNRTSIKSIRKEHRDELKEVWHQINTDKSHIQTIQNRHDHIDETKDGKPPKLHRDPTIIRLALIALIVIVVATVIFIEGINILNYLP